jgi:two-component system sensor histidine kinase UhpB
MTVSTISVSSGLARRSLRGSLAAAAARILHTLWYGRSVRVQLLITLIAIGCVAALVSGVVTVLQARKSTRIEIAASSRLADTFVRETIRLMPQDLTAERFLATLPLQLRVPRHVRISVTDAAGRPVTARVGHGLEKGEDTSAPPRWFAALIGSSIETRDIPILLRDQRIGTVSIVSEPSDEIEEVWENTVALAAVALPLDVTMIGLLYILFGRVLDPLTGLGRGLSELEQRNYRVRLVRPRPREFASITDRFNALAEALEAARDENARLTRRLISAQDDERRRMALDLHDEVGPSLFGLKAAATSMSTGTRDAPASPHVSERAREMLAIIDHLQALNRSLLNRLRPMALGHIPIADLLSRLVRERGQQHPQIAFAFAPGRLQAGYGDSVDLTVYRCTQEALTNAIRHARAGTVAVTLGEAQEGLVLTVQDDGAGMAPDTPQGFGLSGMRERVAALGGSCLLETAETGGLRIRITIPESKPDGNHA